MLNEHSFLKVDSDNRASMYGPLLFRHLIIKNDNNIMTMIIITIA